MAVTIRTKPGTHGYNSGKDTFPRRGQRFAILGRTQPGVKGQLVRLVQRFSSDTGPIRHNNKIHTFATVKTDARGRFVYRGWEPRVTGGYEFGAHYISRRKGIASSWSCARQLSLFK